MDRIERGMLAEERVGQVIDQGPMPWWFLYSRKATSAEDQIGIDRIIYTRHVGRILLQVKSSKAGAAEFNRRTLYCGRPYRVHVVIAPPELPLEEVLGRVLAACITAIEEAKAADLLADNPALNKRTAAA